jgi:ACS family sodium-dependent inorganic phosphate cotransporter
MAGSPDTGIEAASERPTRARGLMYALTAGVTSFNFLLRQGIPMMIIPIAAEYAWSGGQQAILLAGFFPGYMLTQVPGGWAAQVFGGKLVNALNLGGQTAFLALLPSAARLGAWPLALVFTCLGLCQGPLVPAQAVLQRHWMPLGGERAWASRMTQIGQRVGKIATTSLTPWLSSKYGWRALIYCYCAGTGLFTLLFCAIAKNTPREWNGFPRPWMNGAEVALLEAGVGGVKKKAAAGGTLGFPWYLFRVGAANVIIISHIAANATEYTLTQWAPTFFIEKHGVSAASLGAFLTLPQSVAFAATFVTAALENAVLKAGVPLLAVRRAANLLGSALHLTFLMLFGLAPTARLSMLAYCGVTATQCIYGSGHIPNYNEVFASDVGVGKAVGNTVANAPGAVIPALGVLLRARFGGSWMPLFGLVGGFQLFSGLLYARYASVEPAAELLQRRREKAA